MTLLDARFHHCVIRAVRLCKPDLSQHPDRFALGPCALAPLHCSHRPLRHGLRFHLDASSRWYCMRISSLSPPIPCGDVRRCRVLTAATATLCIGSPPRTDALVSHIHADPRVALTYSHIHLEFLRAFSDSAAMLTTAATQDIGSREPNLRRGGHTHTARPETVRTSRCFK
jgi:hypothetical protein